MPPAIADSDDDGEDEIVVGEQGDNGGFALSQGNHAVNKEAATGSFDGTNERSTGSTGKIWFTRKSNDVFLILDRAIETTNPKCRARTCD